MTALNGDGPAPRYADVELEEKVEDLSLPPHSS
jgi:hypothetical protein